MNRPYLHLHIHQRTGSKNVKLMLNCFLVKESIFGSNHRITYIEYLNSKQLLS